jgi:hypothetical protein
MSNETGFPMELKVSLAGLWLVTTAFFVAMIYPQVFNNVPRKDLEALQRRYDSAQTYWSKRKDSITTLQAKTDTVIAIQTTRINTVVRERATRIAEVKSLSNDSLVVVFRYALDSARIK